MTETVRDHWVTNKIYISEGSDQRQKVAEMSNNTQRATFSSSPATNRTVAEMLAAHDAAAQILAIGKKRREIAETKIQPGWAARYSAMPLWQKQALKVAAEPSIASYGAALFVAGVTKPVAKAPTVAAETVTAKRPELIDTPEARAAALAHFGIIV